MFYLLSFLKKIFLIAFQIYIHEFFPQIVEKKKKKKKQVSSAGFIEYWSSNWRY